MIAPPPVIYLASLGLGFVLEALLPDANPYRPSTALATDGPYRFSRNPAYLGMAITYIGITLAAEAPWALVMLVPATLLMHYGVICARSATSKDSSAASTGSTSGRLGAGSEASALFSPRGS